MNARIITTTLAIMLAASAAYAQSSRFMGRFKEDFSKWPSENFNCSTKAKDFRYFPAVPSLSEKGTDIMLFRFDPADPAGAGKGPEISSTKNTHFGTYSARIRVPDVKAVQPNVGAVVGYFTYRMDKVFGLSEIDFEWLIADPRIIYVGTWTSDSKGQLQRIGRTVDLSTGHIFDTGYRSFHDGNRNHPFNDDASTTPKTIKVIKDYNAAKQFYVYGFDWHTDRLTWWVIDPETNEKIILWDYTGTTPNFSGIPQPPTTYLLNFWHTNDWPVETNPKSLEAPAYPYSLEIDWMSYEPFVEESEGWIERNGWK